MKKREYYKVVIPAQQLERIKLNQCPSCGKHKDYWDRRTDWTCCSKACTEIYMRLYVSYGWQDVRIKAFMRDNYTCKECGFRGNSGELVGDHITPIALGGEEFDLDNVQTLCIPCDKIKTSSDLKKIARQRRLEKLKNK